MAIITTSAFISDITGKIQGTTFQRTQGGLCARNQRAQRNSNTNFQQFNKTAIATILNDWVNLTQSEREQWNQYAIYRNIKQKRNNSRTISGQQIFIRENNLRYAMKDFGNIFLNPIHSTPLFASPPQPISITTIVRNGIALEINLDRTVIVNIDGVLAWISAPIRQSQKSRYIKRKMIKADTNSGTIHEVNAYYTSVYGRTPEIGEFISIEIGIYNDPVKTFTKNTPIQIEVT